MGKYYDISGKEFGHWIVLNRGPNNDTHQAMFYCKCGLCNKIHLILKANLTSGKTKKCSACSKPSSKHNMSKSPTYSIWVQMIRRCHYEDHPSYKNYGARGISVCKRWRDSFSSFLEDMGERPKNLSLERIDNDRGYCKENCKWATWKDQCKNKSGSIKIADINNGWIVINRVSGKRYEIKCLNCYEIKLTSSCNFRRRKKHCCGDLYEN